MAQSSVEWLVNQLIEKSEYKDLPNNYFLMSDKDIDEIIEQAKAMHRQEIMKTARQCHFEGVRQSAKTSEGYIMYGEKYYNETFGDAAP